MMRVTVPYTYEAEARNGAGIRRTNDLDASYTAEVPEVDPAEAPVVLRHAGFFSQRPYADEGHARPPAGGLADVRMVRGKLYEQVVWNGYGGGRTLATAEDLALPAFLFCDVPYVAKRAHAPDARYWNEKGKTVYESTKREEARKAVAEAVDLACVDGLLYRASPEPVFVFDDDDDRHRPRDRTFPRIGRAFRHMHAPTFRLDDADLVAEMVLARGGTAERAAAVTGMVEVLDVSALSDRLRGDCAREAGRRLARSAAIGLHERSLATMLAYADLRDVARDHSGREDPDMVTDLMAAYCAAVDAEPAVRGGGRDPGKAVAEARIRLAAHARRAQPRLAAAADAGMASFTP